MNQRTYTPEEQEAILAKVNRRLTPEEIQFNEYDNTHYIGARLVYDHLNTVCPADWSCDFEIVSLTDNHCVMKCALTIAGITRYAYGRSETKRSKKDAVLFKGAEVAAESHAIKRAAVKFNFGIDLYPDVQHKYPPAYGNSNRPVNHTNHPAQRDMQAAQEAAQRSKPQSPNSFEEVDMLVSQLIRKNQDKLKKEGRSPSEFVEWSDTIRAAMMPALGKVFKDSEERYKFCWGVGLMKSVREMPTAQRYTILDIAKRRDAKKLIKLVVDEVIASEDPEGSLISAEEDFKRGLSVGDHSEFWKE